MARAPLLIVVVIATTLLLGLGIVAAQESDADIRTEPTPLPADADFESRSTKTPWRLLPELPKSYKAVFLERRKEHYAMAKRLLKYEVAKLVDLLKSSLKPLVRVLEDGKAKVEAWEATTDLSTLPTPPQIMDIAGSIWENTAFFGDLVLRHPQEVAYWLKKNKVQIVCLGQKRLIGAVEIIRWSYDFTKRTLFSDPHTEKVLALMGQELAFEKADPNYKNPFAYTVPKQPEETPEQIRKRKAEKKRQERQSQRKPKLSEL